VAFANLLGGARRVQPMPFSQIIRRSWLVVLLASRKFAIRCSRAAEQSEVLSDALAQPEKRQDSDDDHD
jgi:hypothetical protein